MDAISSPEVEKVVVIKGAQVGWTEILNNATAYYIDQDPAPLLVVQPTLEMAQTWSKDRLAPMLRDTPALHGKVKDPRSRDSDNTQLHKVFPGGHVTIIGANSPASLASRPIRVVLADEVDRYPVSAGTEGDPLKLAAKRQTTFWNRKTLIGSTPTIKGASVIEREWERSDQRRYFVPCPHCDHAQVLRWQQVRWDKGEDGQHKPESAHYVCEACGTLWTDVERWAAVSRGEWRATAPSNRVAGFHIPGFLSPWLTLEEIVREFLEAKDHPELLQVWVNTVLGEPWEEQGETVVAGALSGRSEAYDGDSLPDRVLVLNAGVDVQGDRLEVQVIGFGLKEEAWPCLYEVLHGDPAQPAVWQALDTLTLRSFRTQSGRTLRIRSVCIDTGGHHAAQVFSFCRARRARRMFPTKGAAGPRPIWPKRASRAGSKGADTVFIVGVDTAKDAIYGRLRIAEPGPGYVHFPASEGFDDAYFEQLTSEQVVTRYREGRPYRVWVLQKGRRNEALDTFVLALAALRSLPIRLETIPAPDRPEPPPDQSPPPADPFTAAPPRNRNPMPSRGGGFLQRRRGWLS